MIIFVFHCNKYIPGVCGVPGRPRASHRLCSGAHDRRARAAGGAQRGEEDLRGEPRGGGAATGARNTGTRT